MKRMMGILDTDPAYAEKLAERLCEREDFPYWVFLFLRKEELVAYTEGHHIHLLLVASSLADEEIMSLPADRILILSEDDDQEKACKEYSDSGSFAMSDPYQPCEEKLGLTRSERPIGWMWK